MVQKVLLESTIESVMNTVEETSSLFSSGNINKLIGDIANWGLNIIFKLVLSLLVWKIGKYLVKLLLKICDKALSKGDFDIGVIKFISSILRMVAYAIILIAILDILGIQTASIIAVFGSAALALSMSLQGSLSNLAGGILIMLFKPFTIGDYVLSNGCEGTVVSIDMLYTKLKTPDNKIIMMPNGSLANSNITNVGAAGIRRLDIEIGIAYGSDISKSKQILESIMKCYPAVDKEKDIQVIVKSLDDSCVTLETRCWVKYEDYWDTRFLFLEKYKIELDKNGIEIPFHQIDVYMKSEAK